MNLMNMKNAVTSTAARRVLIAKKNSPQILFGAGVVGVVTTTVLACRATLKLESILDEAEATRAKINTLESVRYSEKDRQRDNALLTAKTAIKIGRVYAPAVVVGSASIAALTGAHVQLTRRNAGLTAAYAALDNAYRRYQDRVREELGEEKERDLRLGVERREIETHDTKKGEVKVQELRALKGDLSMYARLFDEHTSASWKPQPEYNLFFFRAQQDYANDRLNARGFVLLNDVYDALGLERTTAGAVVGWVKGGLGEDSDNHIDFGVFRDDNMTEVYDFMVGNEGSIWLDFNVHGVVYDLIDKRSSRG